MTTQLYLGWKSMSMIIRFSQVFFLTLLFLGCKEANTEIIYPSDLEALYLGKESCKNCKGTVVFYLDGTKHSLYAFTDNTVNWKEYALVYPEIEFKIFLGNKIPKGYNSLSEVKDFFLKQDFPYTIYWDPENKFYECNRLDFVPYENKTFQIYLVAENKILSQYQFGMPSLRQSQLLEYFNVSPVEINP